MSEFEELKKTSESEINKTEITEDDEITEAEKALKRFTTSGEEVYKLIKPVTVNGTSYTELKLDFNSLTSADLEAIEASAGDIGHFREFSKKYQLYLVAHAAKTNINVIRSLSIKDATVLTIKAQSFLMSAD